MDQIDRHFGGKKRTYNVYTREEADQQGVAYEKDWKRAMEGGWVLTDDDWVVQCHKRRRYKKKNLLSDHLTFTFCRKFVSYNRKTGEVKGNPVLRYQPFRDHENPSYCGGTADPSSWKEREAKRFRTKRAVRMYAALFVAREGKLTEDDWVMLGALYRPKQKIPKATFRRLLKEEIIQNMVAEELKKILLGQEISEDRIIQMYEEVRTKAITEDQLNVAKGVIDRYADMLDMKPDKKRQVLRMESATYELGDIEDEFDQSLEEADYDELPPATEKISKDFAAQPDSAERVSELQASETAERK